jgi:hypothetical protein
MIAARAMILTQAVNGADRVAVHERPVAPESPTREHASSTRIRRVVISTAVVAAVLAPVAVVALV